MSKDPKTLNDADLDHVAGATAASHVQLDSGQSTNIGSSTGGGGGSGKVKFERLTIKKYADTANTGSFRG